MRKAFNQLARSILTICKRSLSSKTKSGLAEESRRLGESFSNTVCFQPLEKWKMFGYAHLTSGKASFSGGGFRKRKTAIINIICWTQRLTKLTTGMRSPDARTAHKAGIYEVVGSALISPSHSATVTIPSIRVQAEESPGVY